MRKEMIETGKTVEDAINSACEKMACDREDVQFEIMDLPRKSFLGLKIIPAKVRVWIEEPEKPAVSQPRSQPQPSPKQTVGSERPQQQKKKDSPKQQPQKEKAVTVPATPSQPQPKKIPEKHDKKFVEDREENPVVIEGEVAQKCDMAISYLKAICEKMGLNPTFKLSPQDGGVCINVEGEGLGAMIGRRGETLDSLQYLAGLVANRLEGDYLRLTLDCGQYRTKRKATLEALAKKLAGQVLKTNISKTLEPMNPFERRIIHATVSEIQGVSSTSVGEEPNRRVVITSPTAKSAGRGPGGRGGRDSSSGGYNRRRGGGRSGPPRRDNRRSSNQGGSINTLPQSFPPVEEKQQPVSSEPKKTPEATNDKPLYAKLDLE